jgi:hypothetical protein
MAISGSGSASEIGEWEIGVSTSQSDPKFSLVDDHNWKLVELLSCFHVMVWYSP